LGFLRDRASQSIRLIGHNKVALTGTIIIVGILLMILLADVIAPYDPEKQFTRLVPPCSEYLLGTDRLGRDVTSRLIYGGRASLMVAVVSVTIAMAVGVPIGLISGYFGKTLDNVLMRIMDVIFSLPALLLAITIVAILGPGLLNAAVAVGVSYVPRFARITRGPVMSVKERPYVEAARAIGASSRRIVFKYVLPNASSPIIIQTTLALSSAILAEAAISYLGLGVQPPTPSWGSMLNEAKLYLFIAPWLSISPGIAIVFTVLGLNLLGDGLRDVFDPRLRRRL